MLIANRADIERYGCPVGTLCTELAKLNHASHGEANKLYPEDRALHESNPMLGWRACRLGLSYPEIYEMQVRAIARAALAVRERWGRAPLVEIMIPLLGN